jgi:PAS domain S-box-containing protein
MDHEGRITEFNRAAEKIFGYSREEVLGIALADVLVPPRLRESHRIGLARYLATGEGSVIGKRIEISALRRDGAEVPVELAITRVGSGAPPSFTGFIRDISERKAAEKALQASEERYRLMFDSSPLPMWVYDKKTLTFLAVNEAAVRLYGYSREEFAIMTVAAIRLPEDLPRLLAFTAGKPSFDEGNLWRHRKKDGSIITVEINAHDIQFEEKPARLVLANDVTERLRLEDQLRQAQKMEAVGRLARGVAHDFNNVLYVILTYAEMLLMDTKPGEPMRDDLEEIRKAGKRAADLTRQLVMFSRQQVLKPEVLDVSEVLTRMDEMLQRILGADVDLLCLPSSVPGRVFVDPDLLEQVIKNLVVNARDAMPSGGKLTIETDNVVLDEAYAREHVGVSPGPHVMLAVTDTGTGIDKATLSRIFEPFFTTKGVGKGTGLGLSTVLGIVEQSGGSVRVDSEPGKGTTFKVYLPFVNAARRTTGSVARA